MTNITNTSQLNTFSIVRSIILSNTTLATKFNINNIYEFEPKHKSSSFGGFPYIVIKTPDVAVSDEILGDVTKNKEFDIEIIMRMDYSARGNFQSYASNLIAVLESSNSDFQSSGYDLEEVRLESKEVVVINQKELIEGVFSLTLQGEVRT